MPRYVFGMESKLSLLRRRAAEEYLAHANTTGADDRRAHLGLAKYFESLALAVVEQERSREESSLGEA